MKETIGRSVVARDGLGPERADDLLDLLGHSRTVAEGEALPLLSHWLHFHPVEPYGERGPDGHRRRGKFLPALPHLPRRMWAGSSVRFHAPLVAGRAAVKRSTITALTEKEGRSGPLAFATLRHEISDAESGDALVSEDQTLVFREAAAGKTERAKAETSSTGELRRWQREVTPDAVMLFRYSALTWNSHRIHYDYKYATVEEGYPNLVIHGPLSATLLMDLALRESGGREIAGFTFQAKAPLFLGDTIALSGGPNGALSASRDGVTCVEAKVTFA